jgi:soluble lytic murein transglycosylase-like protein
VGMPDIPASVQQWEALATQAATHFSLPLVYFARQINQESGFSSTDAQGHVLTSSAGAEGIAQFKPETAASIPHCVTNLANPPDNCVASSPDKAIGIDPTNPAEALPAAAYYMKQLLNPYLNGNSFTEAYAKALAAYNASSDQVDSAVRKCGNTWLSCMAQEPQEYVHIIMGGDYHNS